MQLLVAPFFFFFFIAVARAVVKQDGKGALLLILSYGAVERLLNSALTDLRDRGFAWGFGGGKAYVVSMSLRESCRLALSGWHFTCCLYFSWLLTLALVGWQALDTEEADRP